MVLTATWNGSYWLEASTGYALRCNSGTWEVGRDESGTLTWYTADGRCEPDFFQGYTFEDTGVSVSFIAGLDDPESPPCEAWGYVQDLYLPEGITADDPTCQLAAGLCCDSEPVAEDLPEGEVDCCPGVAMPNRLYITLFDSDCPDLEISAVMYWGLSPPWYPGAANWSTWPTNPTWPVFPGAVSYKQTAGPDPGQITHCVIGASVECDGSNWLLRLLHGRVITDSSGNYLFSQLCENSYTVAKDCSLPVEMDFGEIEFEHVSGLCSVGCCPDFTVSILVTE